MKRNWYKVGITSALKIKKVTTTKQNHDHSLPGIQ